MINNIKTVFSIKDLENLSGVKAHTIRIWEKRYDILEPIRTETNIRTYDSAALQKLLNIVLLNNYGYKISRIAAYSSEKIGSLVREIISNKNASNHALNAFKLAMINFDSSLFMNTYNNLLSEKTFREVFTEVLIPLLDEVGLLWQSNTISPAQEHFVSFLIKQKILVNTEKIQISPPTREDKIVVLFLPENEIHELGLMYLNYELLLNGYRTIYLGQSVPTDSLVDLKKHFKSILYVSYFTVKPIKDDVNKYLQDFETTILDANSELWILGRLAEFVDLNGIPKSISVFKSITELIEKI